MDGPCKHKLLMGKEMDEQQIVVMPTVHPQHTLLHAFVVLNPESRLSTSLLLCIPGVFQFSEKGDETTGKKIAGNQDRDKLELFFLLSFFLSSTLLTTLPYIIIH